MPLRDDETLERPALMREQQVRLFWDAQPTGAFPEWEIGRILTFGTLAEVRACVRRFGMASVQQALANHRSIPADVRDFWLRYGLPAAREVPAVLHREVLPPHSACLLPRLSRIVASYPFMLCGGTAVALRLGHRYSEDLDLFTPEPFDVEALAVELRATAVQVTNEQHSRNTWHGIMDGVRVSFIRQIGVRLTSDGDVDGVALASLETLAALKLNAVAGRGERKDFIDVFALCHASGWTVADLMRVSNELMPSMNDAHLLRSLTHFRDAEETPMPHLLWSLDWDAVKAFFERSVRAYLQQ